MGFAVQAEYIDPVSGYSIDLVVSAPSNWVVKGDPGNDHDGNNIYAIEVDGPGHFARPDQNIPLGNTVGFLDLHTYTCA